MTKIQHDSCVYRVDKKVGESQNSRLYICTQDGVQRQYLLQIAADVQHNVALQRAAFILTELARRAEELEAEYAAVKKNPAVFLNYNLGFPELVDSFVCPEQGNRQVNILAFRNVEDLANLVPLANITEKDRMRVDLKTSAWIMGKLLKVYDFAVSEGFSVDPNINTILIESDQHYVLIFDWTGAEIHSGTVPAETRRKQISHAAQVVIMILGGDPKTGTFPEDTEEASQYTNYLLQLSHGGESNAKKAHTRFYEIVDSLWERKYHPFTSKPLES